MSRFVILVAAAAALMGTARAQTPETVFLEELTWTEVRDAIRAGKTTVIIPTGGLEQSGPHLAMGKHNFIIEYTSEQIARRLGNALVAPVMTYVPQGDIDPPTSHMRYPGTITLPTEHFVTLLEYAARSLKATGFTDIAFIGDSGGNQEGMKIAAERLAKEWAGSGTRVHFVAEYYSGNGFNEWLTAQGITKQELGVHAAIAETSQVMAVAPEHVRTDKIASGEEGDGSGTVGDPRRASAAFGKKGLELKIAAAVKRLEEVVPAR